MSGTLLEGVKTDLWIGGRWQNASDDARFDVENPATEQVIASVASATVGDCLKAIDAAQGAFAEWAAVSPRARGEVLRTAYDLMVRSEERRVGKSVSVLVDLGGRRIIKKTNTHHTRHHKVQHIR